MMNGNLNVGNSDVVNGSTLRAALSFDPKDSRELMVKVAISPVDNLGARTNMYAEAKSWDFDEYVQAAHDTWQRELSRIDTCVDATQHDERRGWSLYEYQF